MAEVYHNNTLFENVEDNEDGYHKCNSECDNNEDCNCVNDDDCDGDCDGDGDSENVVVHQRLYQMMERMTLLEAENAALKQQNENNKKLMEQMQESILDGQHGQHGQHGENTKAKTPRKKNREQNEEVKAKAAYYKDHKSDAAITKHIRNMLDANGFKDMQYIPWQLVRYMTDAIVEGAST
jgi:predicted RNase H-like nuclease (RuvC/YqgF family)